MNITDKVKQLSETAKKEDPKSFAIELEDYVRERTAAYLKIQMKELKDGTVFFLPKGQEIDTDEFAEVMRKSGVAEGKKIGLVVMEAQAIQNMRIIKM